MTLLTSLGDPSDGGFMCGGSTIIRLYYYEALDCYEWSCKLESLPLLIDHIWLFEYSCFMLWTVLVVSCGRIVLELVSSLFIAIILGL